MAVIRNLVVKISADISSLSKGLQSAQKTLQKVSQTFTKLGTKLTTSVTLPIVALGTQIVKTSSDFEQSMANAASVAGATGEELERMTDIAREMGSKTVFSASDAADALYYMASAGYKVDQMAASIEATLNLASATQYDLAATTDIVIATLNQFGLEASSAERVTNVFASAIGNSMASMDKLSNSMGYVGPVANSLGYEIEETVGALSVLYNAGYDGSTAGTTLRQALVSLMNPTSSALAVFEELGLTYEELNPATNDFADIVDRLGESGLTTAQAMEVFGARGGPGMLALLSKGGDAIRDMTASITGTNKANEMAAIQLDTLTGQWKILKSELEEIQISFGDVLIPMIRDFISKYISPLTAKLMSLNDVQKQMVVKIALIAAAIGPLLLGVGKVIGMVSSLIKFIPLLFSKVTLIIAVIAAVAGGLVLLYKNNEEFRNKVLKLWDKIKSGILKAVDSIKAWWQENGETIKKAVVEALQLIATIVIKRFEQILDIAKKVWPYIKEVIIDVITAFKNFWEKYGEKIKELIIIAFTKIGEIISKVIENILILFSEVWPKLKQIVSDSVSGIKTLIEQDGNGIMNVVKGLIDFIVGIVKTFARVLSSVIQKMVDQILPIWESLKGMFVNLWETIKELYVTLKPIFDLLGAVILTLFSIISGVINGVVSSLGPATKSIIASINVVLDVIKALCTFLRGDWSQAWEYVKQAGIDFWESLKQFGLSFWEFFKGFAEGFMKFFEPMKDAIVGFLSNVWDAICVWFEKVKQGLAAIGEWIWSWVETGFNAIKEFFVNVGNGIVKTYETITTKIGEFFTNVFNGIKKTLESIWTAITDKFNAIGSFFEGIIKNAFNWGKNLIDNIGKGIEAAWDSLVDGLESVGNAIADFLGFGSPTKKGPGSKADEWIPNLLNMMKDDMYEDIPMIRTAALNVASALSMSTNPNRAMVGQGSSPFGDLLNGMLQASNITQVPSEANGEIVLQIDGQTFARLIAPKLTKEYKRNGITLREV